MKGFKKFLSERNVHQLHLEQLSFNGVDELRRAINILRDLREQMSSYGSKNKEYNVTQKWDGAPAIMFGINPENGKFFVTGKSLFAKNPRLMYEPSDIDNDRWYSKGGLANKMKETLKYLKPLVRKGIYQGDLMFSKKDLKKQSLGGVKHITFRPNTITYAVENDSDLGKRIMSSKIGIVIHTRYDGNSLDRLQQNFNINIDSLNTDKDVWVSDAYLPSYAGVLNLSADEQEEVNLLLSKIGSLFKSIPKKTFDMLNGTELGMRMETAVNQLVRMGKTLENNMDIYWNTFEDYVDDFYDKKENNYKTDEKKKETEKQYQELMKQYIDNKGDLTNVLHIYNLVSKAKMIFVRKFEEIEGNVKTFISTDKGYEPTKPEGFCTVSSDGSLINKLVDRMTFSKNNFNVAKTW